MKIEMNRRRVGLILAALTAIAGNLLGLHDTPLLVVAASAIGFWGSRKRLAVVLTVLLVAAGLFWSSQDSSHCSTWWRGRTIAAKLMGRLPLVSWEDIGRMTFSACYAYERPHPDIVATVEKIGERQVEGHYLEQFRTGIGDFWLVAPGRDVLRFLLWEMTKQHDYENGDVAIRSGDTVIDCGAHVGVFTRYALQKGASQVIAIEPEPGNLLCLEANLDEEISQGKVRVVKAGVWNQRSMLRMETNPYNSGAHSFVETSHSATFWELPVMPLDDIVADLGLAAVDFIKMDIEGSERQAIEGAHQTIQRFGPRMAICSYHTPGDPTVIPQIVEQARPGYHVEGKDVEVREGDVVTKVLYFH